MKVSLSSTSASLPPVGVSGALSFGIPVSEWVQVVTIIWLLIQITHLLYKWFNDKD